MYVLKIFRKPKITILVALISWQNKIDIFVFADFIKIKVNDTMACWWVEELFSAPCVLWFYSCIIEYCFVLLEFYICWVPCCFVSVYPDKLPENLVATCSLPRGKREAFSVLDHFFSLFNGIVNMLYSLSPSVFLCWGFVCLRLLTSCHGSFIHASQTIAAAAKLTSNHSRLSLLQ